MSNVDVRQGDKRLSSGSSTDDHDPVPSSVDWVLGILASVIGLALTAASIGIYTQVDEELIRDVITEQTVQSDGISQSELVSATEPFVDWFAVGMGLTGLALIGLAVVYVRARQRTRRRVSREGATTATFVSCAVYGAAAGGLISSVIPGLGALAGGGVGAYLYDGDSSIRVGAATGLFSFALTLPLLVFIGIGAVAGGAAISELAAGATLAGVVLLSGLFGSVFNTGLGALGGYLFDQFA